MSIGSEIKDEFIMSAFGLMKHQPIYLGNQIPIYKLIYQLMATPCKSFACSKECCNYYGTCPQAYASNYNELWTTCYTYYDFGLEDLPGAMAGGITGGVILILVIVFCCVYCNRKKKEEQNHTITHANDLSKSYGQTQGVIIGDNSYQNQGNYGSTGYNQPPNYGVPVYQNQNYNTPQYGGPMYPQQQGPIIITS